MRVKPNTEVNCIKIFSYDSDACIVHSISTELEYFEYDTRYYCTTEVMYVHLAYESIGMTCSSAT